MHPWHGAPMPWQNPSQPPSEPVLPLPHVAAPLLQLKNCTGPTSVTEMDVDAYPALQTARAP